MSPQTEIHIYLKNHSGSQGALRGCQVNSSTSRNEDVVPSVTGTENVGFFSPV